VPALDVAGESVADLGCGDGTLAGELQGQGWSRVYGFEVSAPRVELATRRYPDVSFTTERFPGPLPPESLDLVVSDNVIEHVPDPVSFVRRVRAALRPSGRVVIITPNMESGNYRLLGRLWTPELSPHSHIFLFTHAALARLLSECGFELLREGTFHVPPYPLSEWARILSHGMVKEAAWRAVQGAGALASRVIREGPMLYAVGRVR
jgi:2-polyprenyl-3-methyl-5-hydroxy-6-metoxy-1,4-benzoquinol methylase